ncbi:MAG TPA: hypothetical protein VHX88_14960 [Solirubrobacteraceae bacterium]|nr:hypothetical protein [Solirubrobacteraceae bacterium]
MSAAPTAVDRARRACIIRHSVISGALTLFVAVFLLILVRLHDGHDPVLSHHTHSAGVSGSGGGPALATPAPVSTSQS